MRSAYYSITVSPESPPWRAVVYRGGALEQAGNESDGMLGLACTSGNAWPFEGQSTMCWPYVMLTCQVLPLRTNSICCAWLASAFLAESGPLPSTPLFNRRRLLRPVSGPRLPVCRFHTCPSAGVVRACP